MNCSPSSNGWNVSAIPQGPSYSFERVRQNIRLRESSQRQSANGGRLDYRDASFRHNKKQLQALAGCAVQFCRRSEIRPASSDVQAKQVEREAGQAGNSDSRRVRPAAFRVRRRDFPRRGPGNVCRPSPGVGNLALGLDRIDFKRKEIDVEPLATKNTGDNASVRCVEMADNLIEWLLPFRKKPGPVSPMGSDS